MEKSIGREATLFELLPRTVEGRGKVLYKKRIMIGSADACDVVINQPDVSPIHAVIEIAPNGCKVFDMNSTLGTFVNGKKEIVSTFKLGDVLTFGRQEFEFRKYNPNELPPVLDMLDPALPPKIGKPPKKVPKLPNQTPTVDGTEEELPRVEYPLAQDPKAEFSEYIFEDVDTLYPIFNYQVDSGSVEVIILFKGRVYSVDYLPGKKGTYKLVGSNSSDREIEYAYLGKDEKVDFINIENNEVFVFPLFGYDLLSLSDERRELTGTEPVHLGADDILRFDKGDIQIFVRQTQAPPKVAAAPIFRRDKDLRKYLLLMFLLVFAFLGSMSMLEVDEELEKEKVPERIATILYKKKLTVSKEKVVDSTPKEPKKVVQKAPEQKIAKDKPKDQTDKVPEKDQPAQSGQKGSKQATKVGVVKKAEPNKGPTNTKTTQVKPTNNNKKAGGKPSPRVGQRSANRISPSKGPVDTYKSIDFKSTVSSLLSKGGSTKSAQAADANAANSVTDSGATLGESATVRMAKSTKNIGDLSGDTKGVLDSSKGVEGLVRKNKMFFAGLPYKTVHLGGMDPDVIRRILLEHLPQFRYCYQKELDRASAAFNGVVKLDFIIGASGHVTKAGVETISAQLPGKVKGCVVNVLKGIKFPEPMGGGVVEVSQPMNFYPRKG
ncbi:MAG: FHA domain-containing protein [Deltaproteobacteria bacterium]|nr:MAG: FHA domain-containing protein [Deltaproteobacteria bacterium]